MHAPGLVAPGADYKYSQEYYAAASSAWSPAAVGRWPTGIAARWPGADLAEALALESAAAGAGPAGDFAQVHVLDLSRALGGAAAAASLQDVEPAAAMEHIASSTPHQDGLSYRARAEGLNAGADSFVPSGIAPSGAAGLSASYAEAEGTMAAWNFPSGMSAESAEFVPQAASKVAYTGDVRIADYANGGWEWNSSQPMNSGNPSGSMASQIVNLIQEYLSSPGAREFEDNEGYVTISHLVMNYTPLNRKSFGSIQAVCRACKAHGAKVLKMNNSDRRVRLLTPTEMVLAAAAVELAQVPRFSTVPLVRLFDTKELVVALAYLEPEEKIKFVRAALEDEDQGVVVVNGAYFKRRSYGPHLKKAAEQLLSDDHLIEDTRLRSKVAQCQGGDLPITWLCSRYRDQLGFSTVVNGLKNVADETQTIEEAANEVCAALADSNFLIVDAQRLTVRRRHAPMMEAPGLAETLEQRFLKDQQHDASRKRSLRNAGMRLQQLLDFYFEPFNLQHNRLLLDLISQKASLPDSSGPWPVEALRSFTFGLEDLVGLGRIASELARMRISVGSTTSLEKSVGPLKHLRGLSDGRLALFEPPEVRAFVPAAEAPAEAASAATRYLAVACEQRGPSPPCFLSVLSLNVAEALFDLPQVGDISRITQRQSRLKRQLMLHHTDIICVQGLDCDGGGAFLQAALTGEGYGAHSARSSVGYDTIEADGCSIFWDRTRWQLIERHTFQGACAVNLSPFEDPSFQVRVACLRPQVPTMAYPDLDGLLGPDGCEMPLLVCADLTLLGGAEAASVLEDLIGLRSIMVDTVGRELASPLYVQDQELAYCGGPPTLVCDSASGLVDIHTPDAILSRGLSPLAALSCHSTSYLSKRSPEEMLQQFPALRLPIVAAFRWTNQRSDLQKPSPWQ